MCTVTYVPIDQGYFLTSNRDEKYTRNVALVPQQYVIEGTALIFPKDADAGGTWITLKENGFGLCLLNGAFTAYTHSQKYTISRGQIVLQIASSAFMLDVFETINLSQTAPFTLIIVTNNNLYECRWDGEERHCKLLDPTLPHIWSSATLYDTAQQQKRGNWFAEWVKNNENPSQQNIFHFHKSTGDGDIENDLMMNRNNKLFTVSITGISVLNNDCLMQYIDVITNEHSTVTFQTKEAFA
jgi:uncharacterized protein with NRDE domain